MRWAAFSALLLSSAFVVLFPPGRDLVYEAREPGTHIVALPEGWRPAVAAFTLKTADGSAVVLKADKPTKAILCMRHTVEPLIPKKRAPFYDILVLAPRSYCGSDAMRRYVSAKEKAGFSVKVVALEDVFKDVAGDPADVLLGWLRDEWRRSRFLFLLLIGTPDPYERPISLELLGLPYRYRTTVPSLVMAGGWEDEDTNTVFRCDGWVALTASHLLFGREGVLSNLKIYAKEAGKMEVGVVRKEGGRWRFVGHRETVSFNKGWSYPTLSPTEVRRGDALAFRVVEGSVYGWRAEGVMAHRLILDEEGVRLGDPVKVLPSVMARGFTSVQEDNVGTLPMKLTYPMGTYASLNVAYIWDTHYRAVPTDLCYAAPDGQWDADGDGFFAEALYRIAHWDDKTGFYQWGDGDGEVPLPMVGVGRIPFDAEKDGDVVSAVLDRCLRVREVPHKLFVAAESLSPITNLEGLPGAFRNALPRWQVKSFYTERVFWSTPPPLTRGFDRIITKEMIEKDSSCAADALVHQWLSFNPGIVFIASHGNRDLVGFMLPLRKPPLKVGKPFFGWFESLSKGPPVVLVTIGCNTAQPEGYFLGRRAWVEGGHNWEARPCVAEEALKRFAVCVFGSTRGSWFTHAWLSPRDGGCVTLAYYITINLAKGQPAGIALRNACWRYAELFSAQFADAQNILATVLYGDPTWSINGDVPVVVEPALPEARVGYPYKAAFSVRGPKPDMARVSGLPPGLKWDPKKGSIYGVPRVAGRFFVRVYVESGGKGASYDLLLRVLPSRRGRGVTMVLKRMRRFRIAPNGFRRRGFMATSHQLVSERSWSARCYAVLKYPLVLLGPTRLSFMLRRDLEPSADFFAVELSRDGRTWLPLFIKCSNTFNLGPVTDDIKPRWLRFSVDLSTHIGKVVLLRFRYESNQVFNRNPREGVQIKDVLLEGDFCVGVEQRSEKGARLIVSDGVPVGFLSGRLSPPQE